MNADFSLALRQVMVGRACAPLGHGLVAAALGNGFGDHRLGVVHVAKKPGVGRTGQHAGGLALGLGLGQLGVGDAVHAQRALGHHLALFVELAGTVGAGPAAEFAADALVVIDQHTAVFGALVAGAGGAHRHTGRVFAVQAALGKVHGLGVGVFTYLKGLHPVEKGAVGVGCVGVEVHQSTGGAGGVPLFATGHAGMAAHTHIEVNNKG